MREIGRGRSERGATITYTESVISADLIHELSYASDADNPFAVVSNGWVECAEFVRRNAWAYDTTETIEVAYGEAPEGWGDVEVCPCDSCSDLRRARAEAEAAGEPRDCE